MGFGCDACIGCQPSRTSNEKRGELCIRLDEVEPAFRPAVKAMDKNGDGKVCQSEVPGKNTEEFEAFVNSVKVNPVIVFAGTNILKSELDHLQRFVKANGIKLEGKLFKCKDGRVVALDLRRTKVSNISALKGLTNLKTLNLSFTEVNDISALKGLTNLQELGLSFTKVSDISALKDLTNLKKLALEVTKIGDISALKGLTNLQELGLSFTKVNDISALKGLTNLQKLYLSVTKFSREQIQALQSKLPSLKIEQ